MFRTGIKQLFPSKYISKKVWHWRTLKITSNTGHIILINRKPWYIEQGWMFSWGGFVICYYYFKLQQASFCRNIFLSKKSNFKGVRKDFSRKNMATLGVESAQCKSPLHAGHRTKKSCDLKKKWLAQCREVMFMTPFVVRTKKGMRCSPPTLPPWLLHDNQTNLCISWPTREGLQANLLILHIFIHGWRVYSRSLVSCILWFLGSQVPLVS